MHNASLMMQQLPFWYYQHRPTRSACHNLCTVIQPPFNYRALLSLGLKFIPKPRYTQSHKINTATIRFQRDIYVKMFMAHTVTEIPRLYTRTEWTPNIRMVNYNLQDRVNSFNKRIHMLFKKRMVRSNMLPYQRQILATFRNSKSHIVMNADKNLGPCVIERDQYIKRALQEHLLDKTTYKQLHLLMANQHLNNIRHKLNNFIEYYKQKLSATDVKFLQNTNQTKDPYAKFYITAKVHKTPWKTRPIVSVCGSILDGLGRFVDKLLQPYFRTIPSAVRNSIQLKDTLVNLDKLPTNARFFTADAVSMYTNIDTDHALAVISRFLYQQPLLITQHERCAVIEGLSIIMKNNLFQFGDTYWLQINGTAMGVSPSCVYATLYFAIHEAAIQQNYSEIIFYKRYIDDVIGIWIPNHIEDTTRWQSFKESMDRFGKLRWEFSDRQSTVNFLDLTLTINSEGYISSKIYEKIENLYLYLPAASSHPFSNLKSLIHGMVYRTIRLTSKREDQAIELQNLVRRLSLRGYRQTFITNIINRTYKKLLDNNNSTLPTQKPTSLTDVCFFHTDFHPDDPKSFELQQAFQEEMVSPSRFWKKLPDLLNHRKARLKINRLIIAYHRTPNLGNMLSPRVLKNTDGPLVSSYI
jgi:hypothetical protein